MMFLETSPEMKAPETAEGDRTAPSRTLYPRVVVRGDEEGGGERETATTVMDREKAMMTTVKQVSASPSQGALYPRISPSQAGGGEGQEKVVVVVAEDLCMIAVRRAT